MLMGNAVSPISTAEMMRPVPGMVDSQLAFQQASDGILREQSMIQGLADRSRQEQLSFLDEIKRENFMIRPGAMPEEFASRSAVENLMGMVGFGYNPQTSPYTASEYSDHSRRNAIFSVPFLGTEMAGDRHMANFFRQVSFGSAGGSPLSDAGAMGVARQVRNLDLDPALFSQGFNRAEIGRVTSQLASEGEFIGAESGADYVSIITKSLEGMRSVMHAFRMTGEEATRTQTLLDDMGFSDPAGAAMMMASKGASVGMTGRDMLAAAQMGGALSARAGVAPEIGAEGFMDLVQDLRQGRKIGGLDSWRVNAMGGEMGAAQGIAESSANFWRSGPGIAALLGGSASSPYDILNAQSAGDQANAANPMLGTMIAMSNSADWLYQMTGQRPSAQQAAMFSSRVLGTDLNASMLAYQSAQSFDRTAQIGQTTSEGVNMAGRVMGETPVTGGIGGEFQGAMLGATILGRKLGGVLDPAIGSITNSITGFLSGTTTRTLPAYGGLSSSAAAELLGGDDLDIAMALAEEKRAINNEFGPLARGTKAAEGVGWNPYGSLKSILGFFTGGGAEDIGMGRVAARESKLSSMTPGMANVIELYGDVETGADMLGLITDIEERFGPEYAESVRNMIGAQAHKFAGTMKDKAVAGLAAGQVGSKSFKETVLDPLAVTYSNEIAAHRLTARVNSISDPNARNAFIASWDEQKQVAWNILNNVPLKVEVVGSVKTEKKEE